MNNDIFFPIKGKKHDGHDYIKNIIKNKTIKCFSENNNKQTIQCKSVKEEIVNLSKMWRKKTKSKIIAITGSNGKTTIKDMLFHIINEKYSCSKSEANFNSTLGLPLTFLSTNLNDKFCILELGASEPNEIDFLSKIFNPDIAVITNISKAHIGNFKSFKELIKTKNQLFNNVKSNGKIFLNLDDKNIFIPKNIQKNISIHSYAINNEADYSSKFENAHSEIKINNKNKTVLIEIPESIKHLKSIILSTFAITNELGISPTDFINSIATFNLPDGRGNIINYKNCQLIDDTYNANPSSMRLGIDRLFNMFSKGRKIAVLGDMLELGNNDIIEHSKIGQLLNSKDFDIVFTYGKLMKNTFLKINKTKIETFHFTSFSKLKNMFHSTIRKNDLIYLKGSRSIKLERLYK